MLGFEGVMEIELSDFVVVEVFVVKYPQPGIDIKAIGRAKEISLKRQHNASMLTSRRLLKSLSNA